MLQILLAFDLPIEGWKWLAFILGGVGGMVLLSAIFEWTLIGLSAIIGSVLIVQSPLLPEGYRLLIFAATLVISLVVQIGMRLNEIRQGV